MKRILSILVIGLTAFGVFAATPTSFDFDAVKQDFTDFAQAIANTLPFNASVGLNWSDAYIGSLFALPPHLGAGVTVGITTIPFKDLKPILDTLYITLPADLAPLEQYGFPIPAYTADARVGGILLPFDVGVKLGYLPPAVLDKLDLPFDVSYLLAGADVRLAIIQAAILNVSVGAGYDFMRGSISIPGLLGKNIDFGNFRVPTGFNAATQSVTYTTYDIALQDPALSFSWATNVIDLKAQASLFLLIISPYVGAGASLATSSAGGGLDAPLLINGTAADAATIDKINQALAAAGLTQKLNPQGFSVNADGQGGWAFRVFGGVALNLLIARIDLGLMYNLTSGSYGATLNARLQL